VNRTKKVLISMLVLGALATVGAGTYATFSAQTVNQNNTFATGTILLSNTIQTGTACLSSAAGTGTISAANSGNCSAVFNFDLQVPGNKAFGGLTLKNTGTVNATTLTTQIPSCTAGNRGGEVSTGTADPCTKLDVTVSQVQYFASTSGSTSGATVTSIAVNSVPVLIPASTALTLISPTGQTVAVTTSGVTSAGATTINVNSFSTGGVTYPAGSIVYGGTVTCVYPTGACTTTFNTADTVSTLVTQGLTTITGGLAAGSIDNFLLGLQLDNTADNTFQGRTATFDLNWTINQ